MMLKNKKMLLITSLLTLLPIPVGLLLWDRFPETMAIHWGFTGEADGYASVPFAVFIPPLIMLAVQWLCILVTGLDKGNKHRNRKMQTLVLWIIPLLTNLSCCGIYALALDVKFSPVVWTMVPMGILFAVIGNYLPKTRMNSTIGVKVPWTYSSEANWNATHRFAGKVWVIGGIGMIVGSFLPGTWGVTVMLIAALLLTVVPIGYSYLYYRRQKQKGITVDSLPPISKKAWIAVVLLLIFLVSVLFTGSIKMDFRENFLYIDPSCYSGMAVEYDDILNIEYREDNVPGLRVGGYGSFRLLMGYFQNEEFGIYIRYTYYKPEACVVLTTHGKTIVLSGETREETEVLYQKLLDATN